MDQIVIPVKLQTPAPVVAAPTPPAPSRTLSSVGRRYGRDTAKASIQQLSTIAEEPAVSPSEKVNSVLQNKFAVAGLVFFISLFLLLVFNPPMAKDSDGKDRSWKKIIMWSTLSASLALVIPIVLCKLKNLK